jgi:hypothetical protein
VTSSSEASSKPPLTSESMSTPVHPKRTPSMDDLNQNTELTIESIANSNLFSSSMVSSGGSMIEDQQQQNEELTLFSIAKTITEDSKKAKKQEKEKKEKKQLVASESEKSATAQKRSNIALSQQTLVGKAKARRSSFGKTNDDDDSDEDEDDDDEPKEKKKKPNRLSLNEDLVSTNSKRKNSLKSQNLSDNNGDNSDNEKDTNSLDGTTSGRSTNGGNESSIHDINTDLETNDKKSKTNVNIKNLDVNDQVKVKYGTSSMKSIYPAKIMQINLENNTVFVHYDGWNKRYDEWIKLGMNKSFKNQFYFRSQAFLIIFFS